MGRATLKPKRNTIVSKNRKAAKAKAMRQIGQVQAILRRWDPPLPWVLACY